METENKTPEKFTILVPEKEIKDACLIMEKTNWRFDDFFPFYKNSENISNEEYFDILCKKKLTEKFGNEITQEVLERYEKEKNTIINMEHFDIFLHYAEVIDWAKNNNITLGLGRGSAVGSLICYILGITNVNPLKYNLIFERFMNQEFIYFPDIELDVAESDKEKLTEYILEKYGRERCAIGCEMSFPPDMENNTVSMKTKIYVLSKTIKEYSTLGKLSENLFISLKTASDYEFGLKFKIHSSKSLEIIKKSGKDIFEIPLDNQEVINSLKEKTKCNIFEKIKPSSIDDLAHIFQTERDELIKAGVTDEFIKAKYSENREYYSDLLEPVLKETYGKIIWQEQIIQILNIVGDFSLSEAEVIRRLMARKKWTDLSKDEETFIAKAEEKGLKYIKAKELWDKMCAISPYCYLKAHAIAFVLSEYYTAYVQNV